MNYNMNMVRVLIVENSPTVRELLIYTLSSDPHIQVIGTASDGAEAIEAVKQMRPDVITMDIHMPRLDGLKATRRIMETYPTPIIIVSGSYNPQELGMTFRALESGALAVFPRSINVGHPDYEKTKKELIQTVKLISEVKVVKRWRRARSESELLVASNSPNSPNSPNSQLEVKEAKEPTEAMEAMEAKILKPDLQLQIQVVAIGASTGGALALQTILSELPNDFPAPLLIVQHLASGFVHSFVEWLTQSSGFPVRVTADGELLTPGCAYMAPDNFHLGAEVGHRVKLSKAEPENGLRPSVSYLFRSVAEVFKQQAIGVLLTGMGKDGAMELKLMKDCGAITMAQDKESSVIHGMPGAAIKLEGATYVLPPERIATMLINLVKGRGKQNGNDSGR